MSRYKKVKEWMEMSDWRMWVAIGIAIVMSVSFLTNVVIDNQIKNARDQVLSSTDREENAIKQSRMAAEAGEKKVDTVFDHAFDHGKYVDNQARKIMKEERVQMGMSKEIKHD
jgi:hypothetical protein